MKKLCALALTLALLAASGCASSPNCLSGSVFSNGQCVSHKAVEHSEAHAEHTEEVRREARIVRRRASEETASAAQEAAK